MVSYIVGLEIEFAWAQWKHEEIQEGHLVSGIIIPLIIPVTTPLWMMAVAIAFAVIIAKEIFGGTGMNFLNVALVARAFLFFSYPSKMSGESVWVANDTIFGLGNQLADGFTVATPLGLMGQHLPTNTSLMDMIVGLMPGSIGETSVIAIGVGTIILLWSGVASWKTMLSVFLGGGLDSCLVPVTWLVSPRMVRASLLGWFRFWCCIYGNGSSYIGTHRNRKMDIWLFDRFYGDCHTSFQPGISRGNDACHPVHECLCSID